MTTKRVYSVFSFLLIISIVSILDYKRSPIVVDSTCQLAIGSELTHTSVEVSTMIAGGSEEGGDSEEGTIDSSHGDEELVMIKISEINRGFAICGYPSIRKDMHHLFVSEIRPTPPKA